MYPLEYSNYLCVSWSFSTDFIFISGRISKEEGEEKTERCRKKVFRVERVLAGL